jgi:trk system potassium uptake protein
VLRGDRVVLPKPDDMLEEGDEMLFVADNDVEARIRAIVHGP